jgi:ABC-type multidrug transport system fused ATPase/permease subunit
LRVIKKFSQLLTERQKKKVIILFFMMLLGAALEVCGVSMMLPLVTAIMDKNIITENAVVADICSLFCIKSHAGFVMLCILMLLILYIVKTVYLVFEYYIQYRFIGNNQFAVQEALLNAYLHRPYQSFLSMQSGEVVRVVQDDTEKTFGMLSSLLLAASETTVSAFLLLAVFVISPVMTVLVAFAMILAMLFIVKAVRPALQRQGIRYQESYAQNNKWLLQAISGIKEIKAAQTEGFFLENYGVYGKRRVRAFRINNTLQNVPRFLIEAASICSMLLIIGSMILAGQDVRQLLPALSAFVMAAVKLLPSANRIVGAFNQIAFSEPALDNMLRNIKQVPLEHGVQQNRFSDRHMKDSVVLMELKREILMSGISYSYPGSSQAVFRNMNLSIPIGSSIGIVGASGAGKTTAIDILLGFLQPQEGQVLADGVDVSANLSGWLGHIGYIPQMIFMLDGTMRDNIIFGRKRNSNGDDAVWAALEEAQLAAFVRELPEGLDTEIGERGVRLSGGQRQRVGIARALFTDPQVLIFDEATSALDYDTEEAVMQAIHALHGKKTMVIIAHRLTTIAGCDAVYRVADGKLLKESEKDRLSGADAHKG